MPLDTRIALTGQPLQLESPLAQYSQLMGVINAGTQNQLAQMQMQDNQQMAPLRMQEAQSKAAMSKLTLDQAIEADNYVKKVMGKAAEFPEAPRDPFAAAEQMFNHSNPMVRAGGEQLLKSLQILQSYKNQRDYEASRKPVVGAASINAPAAPMVAPTNAIGSNNLAAQVTPGVAIEPVANAMARQVNPLQDAAALLKKIQEGDDQFARGGTPAPGWKNDRDLLVRAFEQALKPGRGEGGRYLSLGAGKALDQDTGQIISADRVPAAAAAAKIVKIGNVPYTLDAEGTLVPTPIQGGLPIVAKGGAGKAAAGGAAKLKAPSGYRYDPSGTTLEPIPGGPADKTKEGPAKEGAATEGERKAATLLQRLQFSEGQLTEALVQDPNAAKPGVFASAVAKLSTPLANTLTPEARQRVQSAQLDILDAALTLGTGAAYTREQLEGYRDAYFPQLGDKPNAIKDKQARLNNVISAAKIAAGKAAKLVPPASAPAAGEWKVVK
jgi:hypothetical protein